MQSWTLLSLLNWTIEYFTKNKIASPRLDAEVLLAHLLKIERIQLYVQFERPMTPQELTTFKEFVKRRIQGEPVSYIRGQKEFWSLPFKVGPGVLIPRPDTEVLIEQVIGCSVCSDRNAEIRILEIGTGSGCIAIALAKEFPNATIDAIDISEEALKYAKENAIANRVADRINFFCHDFLNAPFPHQAPYDLIVSNPPYISEKDYEQLDIGIKNFEPKNALMGGVEGLDFYRKISESTHLLKKGGFLAVEIGEDQGDAVQIIFKKNGLIEIKLNKDYTGLPRVVSGIHHG